MAPLVYEIDAAIKWRLKCLRDRNVAPEKVAALTWKHLFLEIY